MTEELPHEQPYDLQDNTKCYDTGKDEKKEAALKTIAEWNEEQEAKKQQGISVSEALRLHNENATVRGMIVSISQPFKMITERIVICENESCSNKHTQIYDKPRFSVQEPRYQRNCPLCNNTKYNIDFVYTNAVNIKLQDDKPYGELEQLDVLLFENDNMNVRPGEIVKVTGHIGVEQNNGRGKFYAIMYAQSIKYEQRQELEVTDKDILSLKRFAKMPNVIERLVSMVAPDVIGHTDKKLGLLRSAVGSPETDRTRGRIHTLLIGPPGLAKSMLARAATGIIPNSRFVTAQNASGRGITAIIDKENDTRVLRLGAVPQSRGAICAINEIGRMNYEDQAFLLDAMEEGEFSVDKYGIHVTIKSPTTIVATANPTGTKWNDPVKISNVEIPVLKSLLDRFDQIYAFNEFSSPQEDREYAQRKAEMDSKNIRYSHQYLKTYLGYAKTINPITITSEAKSMLIDFWLEVKAKGLATNRTLDSIFRIAKAHARLHLVEVVDADIATEVMTYYKQTMLQYGEIVKTIESPRDVAYKEMLTIVQQVQGPIELSTAAKMACDRNEQVQGYLGNRLDLKHNWKLQTVRAMLVNNLSIKQVNEKPIVLQWFESSASLTSHPSHNEYGANQSQTSISKVYAKVCDVSEVCDDNKGETITTHSQMTFDQNKKENNDNNNGNVTGTSTLPVLFDASFRDIQMANVQTHQLKPEPSAMDVGCSTDNEICKSRSTATISTLTTNAATNITTTTATATNNAIYRLRGTDTWGCKNCKIKADKHFMEIHDCSGKK